MKDIEFLKQLADDLDVAAYDSEVTARLRQIAGRFENLLTLEQGYKVIEEDKSREAQDRWEDRSE